MPSTVPRKLPVLTHSVTPQIDDRCHYYSILRRGSAGFLSHTGRKGPSRDSNSGSMALASALLPRTPRNKMGAGAPEKERGQDRTVSQLEFPKFKTGPSNCTAFPKQDQKITHAYKTGIETKIKNRQKQDFQTRRSGDAIDLLPGGFSKASESSHGNQADKMERRPGLEAELRE